MCIYEARSNETCSEILLEGRIKTGSHSSKRFFWGDE
jgi:hypothetical protein